MWRLGAYIYSISISLKRLHSYGLPCVSPVWMSNRQGAHWLHCMLKTEQHAGLYCALCTFGCIRCLTHSDRFPTKKVSCAVREVYRFVTRTYTEWILRSSAESHVVCTRWYSCMHAVECGQLVCNSISMHCYHLCETLMHQHWLIKHSS